MAMPSLSLCMFVPGQSVKRHGKSSSLHLKKNFLVGGADFLWVMS